MATALNEVSMPITHNNLWGQVASFENLYQAYSAAARGRRYKDAVLSYRQHLEENIINTLNLLLWKQWAPSRFREFFVFDPKKRLISAPPFKDRVVHHALVQVIAPLFENKFIADSYACRIGKGTHAAKERVEAFAAAAHRQRGEYYVLKGDIKAYFHSINRRVLLDIIERTISDKDVLWLIRKMVEHDDDTSGIPIGALTSQLFANGYLKNLLAEINAFITDRLQLTLNPKTAIYKSGAGICHSIDFCGYRIWPGYVKPRKRTVKSARKRFRRLADLYRERKIDLARIGASVASFGGYMKHCNGAVTMESVLGKVILAR